MPVSTSRSISPHRESPTHASPECAWALAALSLLPVPGCAVEPTATRQPLTPATGAEDDLRIATMSDTAPIGPPPAPDRVEPATGDRGGSRDSIVDDAWGAVENSWLNLVRVVNDPAELERFALKQGLRYIRRLARSQEETGAEPTPELAFRLGAGSAEPRSWQTDQLMHPETYRGNGVSAYPDARMPIRVGIGTEELFRQNSSIGFRFDISSINFDWKHFEIESLRFKPALRWNNFTLAGEIGTDEFFGCALQYQTTF